MEGLGNDYIFLNCLEGAPADLSALAVRLSDRHFGVGADGIICLWPTGRADVGMRIFNADGSEGEMCGNGIRCLGKYVYDRGICPRTALTVDTPAGIKALTLRLEGGQVTGATVDMGVPQVAEPLSLTAGEGSWRVRPVSMGNPHAVVFVDDLEGLPMARLGPALERHPAFPNRTNVEFVRAADREHLCMRVWERGSGETLACGTGACAALAAAAAEGRTCRRGTVRLPGGVLELEWTGEGRMYMTGPAAAVFEGTVPGV